MLTFFCEAGGYKVVAAVLTLAVLAVGILFSVAAFKKLADGYSNKRYRYPNVDNLLEVANTTEEFSLINFATIAIRIIMGG